MLTRRSLWPLVVAPFAALSPRLVEASPSVKLTPENDPATEGAKHLLHLLEPYFPYLFPDFQNVIYRKQRYEWSDCQWSAATDSMTVAGRVTPDKKHTVLGLGCRRFDRHKWLYFSPEALPDNPSKAFAEHVKRKIGRCQWFWPRETSASHLS